MRSESETQFGKFYRNNKLSQLYVIIFDTDLCEDADHVNTFSVVINNDLAELEEN